MNDNAQRRHEDILKLIQLYKERPCLWDPEELSGTNIHERRMAIEQIADELHCGSYDIKNKMKNLRAQFRRELVRMERLNTKRAKWVYYEPLKFLKTTINYYDQNVRNAHLRAKRPKSALSGSELDLDEFSNVEEGNAITSNDDESQQMDTNEELLLNISRDANHTENEAETQDEKTKDFAEKKKSNRKRIFIINRPHSVEERDEFTIFGEHVANELRQLENHKQLQQSLKCSILQSILNVNQANANYPIEEEEGYAEEAYLEEYSSI